MQSNNCNEFLSLVQKECNAITTQIDTFYKKDNQKENIESYFQEQIYDFRDKYANTYTMISDENNKNLGFDLGCSKKLEFIVNKLKNYIDSLGA